MAEVVAPDGGKITIDLLTPSASSRNDHLFTVRVKYENRTAWLLFHDQDKYRLRVNEPNMHLTEFYVGGQGNTIVGIERA